MKNFFMGIALLIIFLLVGVTFLSHEEEPPLELQSVKTEAETKPKSEVKTETLGFYGKLKLDYFPPNSEAIDAVTPSSPATGHGLEVQGEPLVKSVPYRFELEFNEKLSMWFGATYLKIVNLGNADAYSVNTDVNYGISWIGQRIEKYVNSLESRKNKENDLSPAQEKGLEDYKISFQKKDDLFQIVTPDTTHWPIWMGQFVFREKLLSGNPIEVSIKTHWENAEGSTFDTIDKYALQATSSEEGKQVFGFSLKESSHCKVKKSQRTFPETKEVIPDTSL
jgi:hypothetical protein